MRSWQFRSLHDLRFLVAVPGCVVPRLARALRFEQLEDRHLLSTVAVTSTINATDTIHAASTNLLGVNLAYWDEDQQTAETQQLTEAAGLDIFRFPGGAASDSMHFNVADGITIPQFAQFVSSVSGAGMVTVDYGSGSPQEAAAELAYLQGSPTDTTPLGAATEYVNGVATTVNWQTVGYWASLRAASPLTVDDGLNFMRIDHPAPFTTIEYWEIGNEEYHTNETDYHAKPHDPATYAQFAATFSTLAAEITTTAGLPAISIGIDSDDPTGKSDNNWTKNVLSDGLALGFVPGFISDHSYMQSAGSESDAGLLNNTVTNPNSILDWSTRYAAYESLLQQTLGAQASNVAVMATEYNSVSTNPGKQSTSLVNGLYVAESMGGLLDSGYSAALIWDWNNNWQTTDNNSSSLYGWREGGTYGLVGNSYVTDLPATGNYVEYPSYFGMQLASKIDVAGGEVVPATSSNSNLNVYAVAEANGNLELMVVNTSPTNSASDQFTTTGFTPGPAATVWQYGETQDTAQSLTTNGASALASSTATLSVSGSSFSYTFPPYSMTVLDLSPISVTPSGTVAGYAVGESTAVAVDSGVKITSSATDLTGATMTIGTGYQAGADTLHFTSQNGISGVYLGGVLTLTGLATPAQYQAALQSVTFSTTSAVAAARDISIVAADNALDSNTAEEQVNVAAPITVVGAYVSGSAWTTASYWNQTEDFDAYLASHGIGDAAIPTVGYALQTGSAQLTPLPWANINTISVQFSGPVSNIGLGSLELVGGSGGTAPAVTGFKSDGDNTYSWTLASALGNNKYVFAIATTGSSFGTAGSTQVTDDNGVGISGTFTTGSSSFPSGNGLPGSTFDFFFDVLPGDANRSTVDTTNTDITDARQKNTQHETGANYSPYVDFMGAGILTNTDITFAEQHNTVHNSNLTSPTAPSASQGVGTTGSLGSSGFTALALGVLDTGSTPSSSTTTSTVVSNVTPTSGSSTSTTPASTSSTSSSGSGGSSTSTSSSHGHHKFAANDEAVVDFDLADLGFESD